MDHNLKYLVCIIIIVILLLSSCTNKNPERPQVEQQASDYRLVVNVIDSAGQYGLYTITEDGTIINKILNNTDWIGDLNVSHSGRHVVCCVKKDDRYALFRINIDGSGSKQITPYESALYFEPQWFPNDVEILSGKFGYHAQFYRIITNEINITRITADDSISYRFPRLSPDGLGIACEKRSKPNNTIWIMNSDGKQEKLLSEASYEDWQPEWTIDGAKIVYFNRTGLWSINADGSNRKFLIASGYNHTHHCSPVDPEEIVFGNYNGVYTIKVNGSGLTQLADVSCFGYPILWSHDGSRVLFRSDLNNDGEKGICIIKLDGFEIHEIKLPALKIVDTPSRAFDWIPNVSHN